MNNPTSDKLQFTGYTNLLGPQRQPFIDAIPGMFCIINRDGSVACANKMVQQLWGYTPEELTGRQWLELVAGEDRNSAANSFTDALHSGLQTPCNIRVCSKDGRTFFTHWELQWHAEHEAVFCIVRRVDSTSTKDQQQAALWQMLDCITDSFFALDAEWRILYGNAQAAKTLNINLADYINRGFLECFPELEGSVFHQQYAKAFKEKTPVQFEAFIERFDRWLLVNAYPSDANLFVFFRDATEQKRKEEQQRMYEEQIEWQNRQLVSILEHMNQGFISLDKILRVQYFNHKAEEILEVERGKILGLKLLEWYCEPAMHLYRPMFEKVMQEGGPLFSEHICPQTGRWVELSIYQADGGLSAFFRDIDARKKREEEFRRLSLITRETANSVIVTTPDRRITWVNDAFLRNTGFTMAEVLGKEMASLVNGPDTNPATIRYIQAQQKKGRPYQIEILNYRKDGTIFWSEVFGQPIFDNDGNLEQYFSIETDITERKRSEHELRKLSLVAQQTDNIVALVSKDKKIEWVNDAFTRITGYSFEEAVGRYSHEIFDGPATDPAIVALVQQRWEQRQPVHVEVLNYKKNGETYWADVNSQPVFNEKGKLQHFFSIATDITERKRLEEVLEQEKKQRQQMVTAAAITAQERERTQVGRELHDNVNQVLTTVKLYQELCLSGIGSSEELIAKSIQLLQDSINEIRSLSKRLSAPTLGKIKLKDSVNELVDAIAATNRIRIELDTAEIEHLDVAQDVHLAIYRIMQEHLTNILKHAGAEQVIISMLWQEGELVLKISDDGKGFDIRQKRDGIGISNMTTRAESVRGRLVVNSAPGMGCVLMAYIPL